LKTMNLNATNPILLISSDSDVWVGNKTVSENSYSLIFYMFDSFTI
jgi:hypothetical protein